jgi:hypothetical protein
VRSSASRRGGAPAGWQGDKAALGNVGSVLRDNLDENGGGNQNVKRRPVAWANPVQLDTHAVRAAISIRAA